LAEKWVKTIEHEGLYFEYRITFILYVLANKIFITNPTLFVGHTQYTRRTRLARKLADFTVSTAANGRMVDE
jgi:hypothetical protein